MTSLRTDTAALKRQVMIHSEIWSWLCDFLALAHDNYRGVGMAAAFITKGKKIIAIGRNYTEHIKELANTRPSEPFFFLKPTTSYVQSGGTVEIPRGIVAHHEVELGVVIGKRGRDISQPDAMSHIAGYALAVDVTARNLQDRVKRQGLPWSTAKGFDTFTPIGPFIPESEVPDPHCLRLFLKVNGSIKQDGLTSDMIFPIPRLIEHISSIMTVEEGDLILTGTPAGVGKIDSLDNVECTLVEESSTKVLSTLKFSAVARTRGYIFQ